MPGQIVGSTVRSSRAFATQTCPSPRIYTIIWEFLRRQTTVCHRTLSVPRARTCMGPALRMSPLNLARPSNKSIARRLGLLAHATLDAHSCVPRGRRGEPPLPRHRRRPLLARRPPPTSSNSSRGREGHLSRVIFVPSPSAIPVKSPQDTSLLPISPPPGSLSCTSENDGLRRRHARGGRRRAASGHRVGVCHRQIWLLRRTRRLESRFKAVDCLSRL